MEDTGNTEFYLQAITSFEILFTCKCLGMGILSLILYMSFLFLVLYDWTWNESDHLQYIIKQLEFSSEKYYFSTG